MTRSNSFRSNGSPSTVYAPFTTDMPGQTSQRRKDGGDDDWSDFGVGHVKSYKGGDGCIHSCPGGTGGCANCDVAR